MACTSFCWLAWPEPSDAQELALPAPVVAKLTSSAAAFDRTLAARARGKVVIAVLASAAVTDSMLAARQIESAFGDVRTIGGMSHEQFVLPWTDAPALVQACVGSNVTILFVTPGLDSAVATIVKALEPYKLLTVAGALPYVNQGVVLGFDLVSGRPKLVVNLGMAKKHGLDFGAGMLNLARVVK